MHATCASGTVAAGLAAGPFVEQASHGAGVGEHARCSGRRAELAVYGAHEDGVLVVLCGLGFHFGERLVVLSARPVPVYAHGCEEEDVEDEDADCDDGSGVVCHGFELRLL